MSVSSAKQQLLAYVQANHFKAITALKLNLKVSKLTDTQLATAATAGTYDQTYQSVMQMILPAYQQALKQAYDATSGPKGRAMLSADSAGAALLLKQLSPATP